MDEVQVVTERKTEAIVLPNPLRHQIESFAQIRPELIGSQIKPEITDRLIKHDKLEEFSLDTLLFYVSHPDEVDAVTRLEPGASPSVAQQSLALWQQRNIERWRSQEVQLPEIIRNDDDHFTFLLKLSPYRPGQGPLFNEVGKTFAFAGLEAAFFHYEALREAITGLTPPAVQALKNAAREAVRRARTAKQKNEVAQAFLQAIAAQEKWSVLGEDFEPEPLTAQLLFLMPQIAPPEAASQILTSLFRRGEKDAPMITRSMNQPLGVRWFAISKQVRTYLQTCLAIDDQATERALLTHFNRFDWPSILLTDLVVSLPEMYRDAIPVADGKLNYFGREYLDLPPEAATAFQISPDLLAIRNEGGKAIGVVQADLAVSPPEVKEIKTSFIPLEKLKLSRERYPPEVNQAFLEAYPALTQRLFETFKTEMNPAVYPLVSVFELWRYLENHPQEREREEIFGLFKEYGAQALFSFLISAYGQENIPLLLKFAREAQVPREREVEGVPTFRLWPSFPERLLKEYSVLSSLSYNIACRIATDPEKRLQIQDQILYRAKAMTMAAAKLHDQKGELSKEDQIQIQMCFDFYNVYLRAWSAPEDKALQELGVPRELLEAFLGYHDLSDPDVASLFHTAQEFAFHNWAKRQARYAPYYGQMTEVNSFFYEIYHWETGKESEETTGDPPAERARICGILDRCFTAGIFTPESHPQGIDVLSLCCGSGQRIDAHVIEHLNTKGHPLASYTGIEYLAPSEAPKGMKIIQGDVLEELEKPEHQGVYDVVVVAAPGVPGPDAYEIDKLKKSLRLATAALKDGGIIILDLPLPHGEHSIAPFITQHQRKHSAEMAAAGQKPFEPPFLYHFEFQRSDQEPAGKRFAGPGPEIYATLLGINNCLPINLPSKYRDRKSAYDAIDGNDSILQRSFNAFQYPWWQTNALWNRFTIVGYQGVLPEEIRAQLPQPRDISATGRGQS